ncbi:MAG: 2-dehydropantoate 2-reductase [Deltaproteobacteria bacterium]
MREDRFAGGERSGIIARVAAPTVGVMGAGSIGCYVGGKIALSGAEVVLVGRDRQAKEIAEHGLSVQDLDAAPRKAQTVRYVTDPAALAACEVVFVAVKSGQTEEVAKVLAPILREDAVVASLQNGLGNAERLRSHLGPRRVVPGIVEYNVVSRGEGRFHRTMDGPIVLEPEPRSNAAIRAGELDLVVHDDLVPHQWTKLCVNLNNAVSALSDAPTRQILLSPGYRRCVAALIDEGLTVARASGVRPAKLRGVPVGLMPKVLRLPTPIVRLVTGAQMKVDADARSSMWEDLTRGRPTEVDWLNGEIVRRAEAAGVDAPINRRVVSLVHDAERAGAGSPQLAADALWSALTT